MRVVVPSDFELLYEEEVPLFISYRSEGGEDEP